MIGRLSGLVAEIGEEEALIDVGGVGYVVRCGARTLSRLPAVGEETVLHVESQWSESAGPRLYGFAGRDERRAFVALQAIQGVGAKVALAVLDVLPPAELASAVAREDRALIARANGVGPRLAARILTELKDKPIADGPVLAAPARGEASPQGSATAALMGLGVSEIAARRAVEGAGLRLGDGAAEAALIRAALQELGR
jgi:Holliday junction DNA helicase RuvA